MKIDSKILDIDIDPEFQVQDGKLLDSYINVEIWEDGDIELEKGDSYIWTTLNELEEVVRVSKLFKTLRTIYLGKKDRRIEPPDDIQVC